MIKLKRNFMDWIQVITIIVTLGTFMFWMLNKLDSDIKSSNQRVDQLYQMFIDLLRDGKK
jgi:hypothetical protein